jgi:hypothetical protein
MLGLLMLGKKMLGLKRASQKDSCLVTGFAEKMTRAKTFFSCHLKDFSKV